MKVLVVGGGGREHALTWKAAQSTLVTEVLVAPGNAGTAVERKTRNVAIAADDCNALLDLARREAIDLTIVGPEQPLAAGIVDQFEAAGIACFGPSREAARLESSKAYSKAFMVRHGIPTARFEHFDDLAKARAYLKSRSLPIVIKADGLAAGKGVVVATTASQADEALQDMLSGHAFGSAGGVVVIEDFLQGEEASFMALVDGTTVVPLATSQDHKTRDDGDEGPNTGGMGAYSPAPFVTDELHARIMERIMLPTVRGLAADGIRYRGFLYAGLMIDAEDNPHVIEFNCRLGDPETQPILFRLQSDLVEHLLEIRAGTLTSDSLVWDPRAALGVVMASEGYPAAYEKGFQIVGLDADTKPQSKMFHAGTRQSGGTVITDGGRVLCAVGLGETVSAARGEAYDLVSKIRWQGAFWRTDIGHRALRREKKESPSR